MINYERFKSLNYYEMINLLILPLFKHYYYNEDPKPMETISNPHCHNMQSVVYITRVLLNFNLEPHTTIRIEGYLCSPPMIDSLILFLSMFTL
jgi:hypothetical protein